MERNHAPARRRAENETADVRDAACGPGPTGRGEHLDFDDWRTALSIDAWQRGSDLVDPIVDARDKWLGEDGSPEINWRHVAREALSIMAEGAYAEDRDLYDEFSRACEARGITHCPAEARDIARKVASDHARLAMEEDALGEDFDRLFADLLEDTLDAPESRGATLDERCSTIERELASGTDLWWPERSTLVISYWQHPNPTIEVFRVGREAMLDALPRAMADARESGDDRVRLFDVSDHAGTNRHLETASTPDSLHALALNLGQLDGPVVRGSMGTLDECQRAVDERDLSLLPSVLEAGEPLLHGGSDGVHGEGNPNPPLRPSHDGSHCEPSFRSTPSYDERER